MSRKLIYIAFSCLLILFLASSASATIEAGQSLSVKKKISVSELVVENEQSNYLAYNEGRMIRAIEKVKQFARNFRRGFLNYLDNYCENLEKNYNLSCTLEIL